MVDTSVPQPDAAPETEESKKERAPRAKQGKIIVRNLVFDLREKHLQSAFKKFGAISDISVPLNPSTNQNRGFGFVEFASRQHAQNAITEMHNAKYKGRNLTVEFSVPKGTYENRINQIVEHTNMERKEAIKPMSIKVAQKVAETEAKGQEEEQVVTEPEVTKTKTQMRKEARERKLKERADLEAAEIKKPEESKKFAETEVEPKKPKRGSKDDAYAQDCTLFVRNIGWDTDETMFKDFMESFGNLKYAVLCKARSDLLEGAEGADQT